MLYIGIEAATQDNNAMMYWLILIPFVMVGLDLAIFWTCQKQIVANNFTAMQVYNESFNSYFFKLKFN